MIGATLQRAFRPFRGIKFSARISVIDRENKPANEFATDTFDPVQRSKVDLGFVERVARARHFLQVMPQFFVRDRPGDEGKAVASSIDESFLPIFLAIAAD